MTDSSNNKNTGMIPPYFLLPYCPESKIDVFFGVLKSIINRKSIDENCYDSSLKSAMNGENFCIDSMDLVTNWSMLNSHDQRMRQSKLLGYWAIENFTSFGSVLFGKTWKAPERKSIKVVGSSESEEMQPEEIDEKIFQKLSLRILEIGVSISTLAKLKNLVSVPITIGRKNELQISVKLKSFDIYDGCMEKCWRALKSGRFEEHGLNTTLPQSEIAEQNRTLAQPSDNQGMSDHQINGVDKSQSIVPCKRVRREVIKDNGRSEDLEGDSNNESQSIVPSKRLRSKDNGRTEDLDGDSNNDSLRTVLLEMQKNIENLTKWFDPEAAVTNSEQVYGQERLHVMIIKQKDMEIARLKASEQQLLQMSQSLTNDLSNLKEQMEKQIVIINSLRKGIDATSMLNVKSESDLTACRNLIETMKLEIADKNGEKEIEIEKLKNKLQEFTETLAEAQKSESELADCQILMESMKLEFADKNKSKEIEIEKLKNQVQVLNENLADTRTKNVDIETTNATLHDAVNQWRVYTENQSKELIAANDRLGRNTRMKDELKELKSYAFNLSVKMQSEIDRLEETLTTTGKFNSQLIGEKEKLQQEVDQWKQKFEDSINDSNLSVKLQSEIDRLEETLTTTRKVNSQLIGEKEKLQQEVDQWKQKFEDSFNETGRQSIPSDIVTIKSAAIESHSEPFVSDDPIVQECREPLQKLKFGWVRFMDNKKAKYSPAFVHPPGKDGKETAQRVTQDGYVTSRKYQFFDYKTNIDEKEKESVDKCSLKKFNGKFKLNYA